MRIWQYSRWKPVYWHLDLPILSFDAPQNRETLQRDKFFFNSSDELIKLINSIKTEDIIELIKFSKKLKI